MASEVRRGESGRLSASLSVIGQYLGKTPISHGAFNVYPSEARYGSVIFHTLSVRRGIDDMVPIGCLPHTAWCRKAKIGPLNWATCLRHHATLGTLQYARRNLHPSAYRSVWRLPHSRSVAV